MYATTSWGHAVCPFYRSCPLLGVSVIGDPTVNVLDCFRMAI